MKNVLLIILAPAVITGCAETKNTVHEPKDSTYVYASAFLDQELVIYQILDKKLDAIGNHREFCRLDSVLQLELKKSKSFEVMYEISYYDYCNGNLPSNNLKIDTTNPKWKMYFQQKTKPIR